MFNLVKILTRNGAASPVLVECSCLLRGCVYLALLAVSLFSSSLMGESAPLPGIDSPIVLWGYFNFQNAVSTVAEKDPSVARSVIANLGISEGEYQVISRVAHDVILESKRFSEDEVATQEKLSKLGRTMDAETLRQFRVRREAGLADAVRILQTQLSSKSWRSLHDYINGRYRSSITTHSLQGK